MSIASMTGFAREAGVTGPVQWAWEVKTVNGRGLDVRLRVPPGFDGLGEEARGQVQRAFSRGQCQLTLTFTRAATAPRVKVNEEALQALVEALGRVELPETVGRASVDGLLAVRGVVEVEDSAGEEASAELAGELRSGIGRAVEALRQARAAEGAALARIIEGQLTAIEALVAAAEDCPARRPEAVRAKLEAQVASLLDASPALDPARLHQEAVLLAAKADIREEIDRLRTHAAAGRELLAAGGPVGRRLDFLAQELGRESNTLCAKANDIALSRIGLDLKTVVDQFREQVQNVE